MPSARLEALATEPPFFIAIDGGIGLALACGTDPGLPTRGTGVVGRTGGGGVVGTGITRGFVEGIVPSNGPTPFGMLGRGGVGVVGRGDPGGRMGSTVVEVGTGAGLPSAVGRGGAGTLGTFGVGRVGAACLGRTAFGLVGPNLMIFPLAFPAF